MTALDDRPVCSPALSDMDLSQLGPRGWLSEARWTLVRQAYRALPLLFAFTDLNPITGRPLHTATHDDLPFMVSVLVKRLVVDVDEWDALVAAGHGLDVVGDGLHRTPFAMLPVPGPRPMLPGRLGDDCLDCGGGGIDVDTDATISGTLGALTACICTGVLR